MGKVKETAAAYAGESLALPPFRIRLPSAFAWLAHLEEEEQAEFYRELLETVLAAATDGDWSRVSALFDDWKATAEIRADPDLTATLTEPLADQEWTPWENIRARLLREIQPAG